MQTKCGKSLEIGADKEREKESDEKNSMRLRLSYTLIHYFDHFSLAR